MLCLWFQVSIPCGILKDMVAVSLAVQREVSHLRTELHAINTNVLEALKKKPPQPINIEPSTGSEDTRALPRIHHLNKKLNEQKSAKESTRPSDYEKKMKESILKDSTLKTLGIMNESTAIACRLADLYFGAKVLGKSTLTGRNGTQVLDREILEEIRLDIQKHLGSRVAENKFITIWKKCRESIGAKCKHIRSICPGISGATVEHELL